MHPGIIDSNTTCSCHQYYFDSTKEHYLDQKLAEYVYYCAKHHKREVDIPTDLSRVLSDLKFDLRQWMKKIDSEVEKVTSNAQSYEKLKKIVLRRTGYF